MNNNRRKLILGPKQFQWLIDESVEKLRNWKYYNDFDRYLAKYNDDTFEFNCFPAYRTCLPVDIILDECANYAHYDHPLWVYVRNGVKNGVKQLLPISVHRYQPCILDSKAEVTLSKSTLDRIYEFIKFHYYR